MTTEKNHALVLGATGITGWAVTNQLISGCPTPTAFERVTALKNRPITGETLWPKDPRLQVVSGIDLLGDTTTVQQELSSRVPAIETVTQVFFYAYIAKNDKQEEVKFNLRMLKNAITALEALSKSLKFVVLGTGAKAYGIHLMGDFPYRNHVPLSEDLPPIPEPHRSQLFYYPQTDWMREFSRNKTWTWCELRPDSIIGFVPNNNFYCLAQTQALFLALFKATHGEGAECPFRGSEGAWKCLSTDSGQDAIAKFAIHAALHPDVCGGGQAFNVASQARPQSWSEKWPILCEFFGLKGTPPIPGGGMDVVASLYLQQHMNEWKQLEQQYALASGRVSNDRTAVELDIGLTWAMDFDRQLDLTRLHHAWGQGGKVEEADTREVWWTAFQRFRDAKIIP